VETVNSESLSLVCSHSGKINKRNKQNQWKQTIEKNCHGSENAAGRVGPINSSHDA
jgi:Rieske Fe-S protein